ncbi:MAG: hypothetical protein AB1422_15385 [bacterium]
MRKVKKIGIAGLVLGLICFLSITAYPSSQSSSQLEKEVSILKERVAKLEEKVAKLEKEKSQLKDQTSRLEELVRWLARATVRSEKEIKPFLEKVKKESIEMWKVFKEEMEKERQEK